MNIKLIGDQIEENKYYLHSYFKNVINFVDTEKNIASIVKNIEYFSANSILFDDFKFDNFKFDNVSEIKISSNYLIINNLRYNYDKQSIYNSEFDIPTTDSDFVLSKINFIISIIEKLPPKNLLSLHKPELEQYFTSKFEIEFLKTIKTAYQQICEHKYIQAFNNIKARGSGLTPAGDDFIAGFMVGLKIYNSIFDNKHQKLLEDIYFLSKTDNIFSANFLKLAYNGKYFWVLKNFLTSFFYQQSAELLISCLDICKLGSSSGADLLSGFVSSKELYQPFLD